MEVTFELKPGRTKEPARQKWARGALQAGGTESSDLRLDTGDLSRKPLHPVDFFKNTLITVEHVFDL